MTTYAGSARIASIAAETGATEAVLAADAAGRPVELDSRQVAALARVLRRRRPRGPQAQPQRYVQPSQSQLLGLTDREMRRLLQRCVECLVGASHQHDSVAKEVVQLLKRK